MSDPLEMLLLVFLGCCLFASGWVTGVWMMVKIIIQDKRDG